MTNLLIVLLFATSFTHASEICTSKFAGGVPSSSVHTTLSCKKGQVSVHYDACKVPLVVGQRLTADKLGGKVDRSGQTFKQDPMIASDSSAIRSDYTKSGYDIGHMAPAEDMTTDTESMEGSFYFSNAVPQAPKNNRGIWRIVEQRARALAVKQGSVYVLTGGIYSTAKVIGNGVCVPTHVYKIIIDPKTKEGVAYLLPNTNEVVGKKLVSFVTTIEEIEKLSGVNFTPFEDVVDKTRIGFGLQLK